MFGRACGARESLTARETTIYRAGTRCLTSAEGGKGGGGGEITVSAGVLSIDVSGDKDESTSGKSS